jgi:hypothetical protein
VYTRSTTWTEARARVAVAVRERRPETEIAALRRDLRELRLAEHIQQIVDQAPPLTDEQRTRLSALLRPSGGSNAA